jgi:hypothetical protein
MNNYFTGKRGRGFLVLLLAGTCLTSAAYAAEDYICEAKQSANNELAVLTDSCPIGQGLWGREPRQQSGFFWIQCGIFPQPLSPDKAKAIYKHITTNVWLKHEGKGFRCLIGPYGRFEQASSELKQVRSLPAYSESFVRWVTTDQQAETTKTKPGAKAKTPERAAPSAKTSSMMTRQTAKPEPMQPLSPATQVSAPVMPAPAEPVNKDAAMDGITVRRQARVADQLFVVPFLDKGDEQFYMEHGIAWNRLDYIKADNVCRSMDMSLVDEQQWKSLLSSGVMARTKWPLHLPYWGKGKRGLFTSGKVTHLTGTSLLNIVCVK